jgi:soluble lytic murein transglycosylase-like protein
MISAAATNLGHVLDAIGVVSQGGSTPSVTTNKIYIVARGDTLYRIATHFGLSPTALAAVNHLSNPNHIEIGQRLIIPSAYHPAQTRRLIATLARQFGVDQALATAIAWQESGFNENMRSQTGAVGVMQIEPGTAELVAQQLHRSLDLGDEHDNILAGVYWLSYLLRFYGGNEQRAIAAYYEGQGNLARYGFLPGTRQYVADVLALKAAFEH